MLSIQDVGLEIMNKSPKKFYVFSGSEYGIKCKYIDMISESYDRRIVYSESVDNVMKMMRTKHIVPLLPAVYVVRYDEYFVSGLSATTKSEIDSTKIVGTVVCLYEDKKSEAKLDKYLPDCLVSINSVGERFIVKYLHKDFPKLPDRLVEFAARYGDNYNQAKLICLSMTFSDVASLYSLDDKELYQLFGKYDQSGDKAVRKAFASRNFASFTRVCNDYTGDKNTIFYIILSSLLELEKLKCNNRSDSDLKEYSSRWTLKDIYNMFNQTYSMLKSTRYYSQDYDESFCYLSGLMAYSEVPSLEEMSNGI